jgi:7-keto-8-aminopelargonate synthetase-like enzyme
VEDAVVFVSGYATNVGIIDHLMRKNDLVIHDSLAHNSIVTGARLSYAKRMKFSHNNYEKLEALLIKERHRYEKVLIVIEGLYSMDGDIPDIKKIIELKKKYKCLLMVDEAHSLGVLGKKGLGIREHAVIDVKDVDIWMGTLSKSLASSGGFIAGCSNLITDIKWVGAAFIFSVGLAPPLAAASIKAISLLKKHPERVEKLMSSCFLLEIVPIEGELKHL